MNKWVTPFLLSKTEEQDSLAPSLSNTPETGSPIQPHEYMFLMDSVSWQNPHRTATSSRHQWLTSCNGNISFPLTCIFSLRTLQIHVLYKTFRNELFLAHYLKEIMYILCENIFSFETKKLKATHEAPNVYCCASFSPLWDLGIEFKLSCVLYKCP